MAAKSDFAQKLLHDLRLRKERMAATQNSSRHSNQMSRDVHGNPGRTYRGARQINGSSSSRSGNSSRRFGGGITSINTEESSNQIVLYDRGHSSRQVRDLSMAIAFAFENSGKLSKIGTSSSNPLVNFFNRFTRGSMDYGNMEMATFKKHSFSTYQFPTVSHIHINEISKGVQKLNQILRACSNGLDFDRNSIEIGKELLKGAINLEESLRMLVNLQEASEYINGAQQKSRIRLLDEEEEDQDTTSKTAEQRQLDRPRFSFDKPSRNSHDSQSETKNNTKRQQLASSYLDKTSNQLVSNSKMVTHKRSVSCVPDFHSHSKEAKLRPQSSSSQSTQEKGRISNVVAKLMGLEELPQKENSMKMQKELSSKGIEGKERKDRKVPSKDTKLPDPLYGDSKNGSLPSTDKNFPRRPNHTLLIRDIKFDLRAKKSQETPDGRSKMANLERNQHMEDLEILPVGMDAMSGSKTIMTNKQKNHTNLPNHVAAFQNLQDKEKRQNLAEGKERKIPETRESKVPVLNSEPHQKTLQNSIILKDEDETHKNIEFKVSADHMEKRNANKCTPLQMQVLKKPEHSEDKRLAVQKGETFLKQNLMAKKHKGRQMESFNSSNIKQSAANMQKKQSHYKNTPRNEKSMKLTEKVPLKDPPKIRYQDNAHIIDTSHNTSVNWEDIEKEDRIQNSSPRELQIEKAKVNDGTPLLIQEKLVDGSATQKKSISRKVQKGDIPHKIEVPMTKRNGIVNQLTKPLKESSHMLRDLKQQVKNKNSTSEKLEEQSDNRVEEGEVGMTMHNSSEMKTEPSKDPEKLQNEAEQPTKLSTFCGDECQTKNTRNTMTQNDNFDDVASKSGEVSNDLETMEQLNALGDEQELDQCDQSTGAHKESKIVNSLSQNEHKQLSASRRQEQLTENEKDLKEIVIKSQLFLNTAEALFKLNLPVIFLHAGDHNDEVADKKVILDCGCEVMKRKARRNQVTYHPYMNAIINFNMVRSLDDLVKQLCKDFEMLKFYGGNRSGEIDVADYLYKMLNKDISNEDPDINSMWDFEWNNMMSMFPEKEDVIRDVEKHVLNGLLDEICNDLLLTTVSV